MIVDIPQFLYTRVNAAQSPKKKEGFQFLAATEGFPDKKTQMEIECRLHYPGSGIFKSKTTGFTMRGQQGWNLILLFYTDLPEARDAAGRSGIFLVHGFSLPLLDDHAGLLADDIALLLVPHVCRTYENALSMGENGTLPPIQIKFSPNADNLSVTDRQAWIWVQAGLMAPANGQAIAWQHDGDRSPLQMPGMMLSLPLALIEKLSWDDAFDNGKLHFSPVRLTGWKETLPTTGQPLIIEKSGSPRAPLPQWWADLQQHPYFNWLINSTWVPNSRSECEAIFAAGRFLAGDLDTLPDTLAIPDQFFTMNDTAVRGRFRQLAGRVLPTGIAEMLTQKEQPEILAQLLRKNFPPDRLAFELEKHLRTSPVEFSPETIRMLPAPVKAASPLFELLAKTPESWTHEELTNLDDLAVADWAFACKKYPQALLMLCLTHATWYTMLADAEKDITEDKLETLIPSHLRPLGNRFLRFMLKNSPRSKDNNHEHAWLKRANQFISDAPEDASHHLADFLRENRDRTLIGLSENIRRGVAGPAEVPSGLHRAVVEWYKRYLGITEQQLRASGWPEAAFQAENLLGKIKRWLS